MWMINRFQIINQLISASLICNDKLSVKIKELQIIWQALLLLQFFILV